ncbi:response regulator [Halosolutus amylolyticus]|uniref:Response regulator n=1 Tax=Halosolutus amylolyticus TaxID=2932267 RepID=A0ABD5PNK6_9EURY|nr:response regulator [Halosolutus amylolyticus]
MTPTDRRDSIEPATVVLVSESPDMRQRTREGLADGCPIDLHVVAADEALAFLDRRDPFADAPLASLVLLDVRGRVDEIGFLEATADEPSLGRIPVLVLGESPADRPSSDADPEGTGLDVGQYYDRYANAYVPVPPDRDAFADVMDRIARFWVSTARLPNRNDRRR